MLLSNTIPITVASTQNRSIDSLMSHGAQLFQQSDEPAMNIPGLATRQFLVSTDLSNIQEFRHRWRSDQIWIQFPQSNGLTNANQNLERNSQVTFGSFVTMGEYTYHKWIDRIGIDLPSEREEIHVTTGKKYFRLAVDCLDTYFAFDPPNKFFLPLKKSVRCFEKVNPRVTKRIFDLTHYLKGPELADTSTICLTLPTNFIHSVYEKLTETFKLKCFYPLSPISIRKVDFPLGYRLANGADFLSNYGWEMILSLGFRIKDCLTMVLMKKVNSLALSASNDQYPEHRFYSKMIAVYHKAKNNRFFSLSDEFDQIRPAWLPPKQEGYDYVPRIFLTPYGQYPKTLKAMRSNRVLRRTELFGPPGEHFCRVLLRDCDLDCIQGEVLKEWSSAVKKILLTSGLNIGRADYEFLLFSNSQLRDRSLTFYRPFGGTTVENIYEWLGEFKHEKSIGTRLARMAQCFTSTTPGIEISKNNLKRIDDKFDGNGRCFTDGCGRISRSLLKKLFRKVRGNEFRETDLPSVIQFRCSGFKGVLVDAPDLLGDMIHYRPSQEKFQSGHYMLELISSSQPKGITFNQQAATLLEHMGVPRSVFVEFQYISRKRLSMALVAKKSAISLLRRTIRFYDWEEINNSGIVIPQEPFFRSLLMTLCQEHLQKLCNKSHIPVPMEDGRMLYGVVDETDSLAYGEIFVQITDEDSDGKKTLRVIKDIEAIVTRMPCHHPGDIIVVRAVDKPKLRHLKDCVVFPAKGKRPHPTEMSGGDLDGDEYWVCWNTKLVDAIEHEYEPDGYIAPKKPVCLTEPTKENMVDCILGILENSGHVGVLSRRHLALCARNGPSDDQAIELARYINDALDFPKTGVSSMTTKKFRQLNVHDYPDFMQNKTKQSFECNKALGVLFKYMKETLDIHSSTKPTAQTTLLDGDLLVPGYENCVRVACSHYQDYCEQINSILNTYDLKDETELITGCHFTLPEEPHTGDDVETATQDFRALRTKVRQDFQLNMRWKSSEEKQKLISAYYYVTYVSDEKNEGKHLSFPWIFHDTLSAIKRAKSNDSSDNEDQKSHQSLKFIGDALLASEKCDATSRFHLLTTLWFHWLTEEDAHHTTWQILFRQIDSFTRTDERFRAVDNSNGCRASRLGEQFLRLVEFLCTKTDDEWSLEPVANLFLFKLHRIALKVTI